MPNLEQYIDENSECLSPVVDGRAYVALVGRLAERLGSGAAAMRRAARLLYEDFLDAKPRVREPVPVWFGTWLAEAENQMLHARVSSGLAAVVKAISETNASSDVCYMDESTFYDRRVRELNDLALETIACSEVDNGQACSRDGDKGRPSEGL